MTYPYALLRAGFRYMTAIGGFTNTSFPHDLAFGQEGRIYVLCSGNSGPISIINLDDEDLGSFGAPGLGLRIPNHKCNPGNGDWPVQDGALLWPCQIRVDSDELIYISDQATDRITIYNKSGEYQGKWGEPGSADGQFNRPSGIAFDADENMYVVDTMNHRVQKFTKDGRFLMNFGNYGRADGEFDMPWGINIDEFGDVYVVDWRNDRVEKFDADGNYIFQFGRSGDGPGEFNRPSGIAVDGHGDIYVADCGNDRVQLFSKEGRYVQQFLGDASLPTKSHRERLFTSTKMGLRFRESSGMDDLRLFQRPVSVRVDSEFRLFVADHWMFRIQVYEKEAYPKTEEEVAPPLRAPVLGPN